MTSNMISFRKYEEDVRHNREMERLTGEQQAEAVRHNKAIEEETVRTNVANEQIKTQANVINSTHYGKQDFETARHNMITEYYTQQLPEAYGKNQADVNKTRAETGYVQQQTETSATQADLNQAKSAEARSGSLKNLATVDNLGANTNYLNAQSAFVRLQAGLYPTVTKSTVVQNNTKSISNVVRSVTDIINAASSLIKIAKK